MSVVGKQVKQLVTNYLIYTRFSDDAERELSSAQKYVLQNVARAGGGDLIITSANRSGSNTHGRRLALDFGGKLPILWKTAYALKSAGYMGGVGLGIPPAALHLHVDGRGFHPAYQHRRADGSDARYSYFIETGRPDSSGANVPSIPMTYENLRRIASYYDANAFALARIPEYIQNAKDAGNAFVLASGLTLATVVVWAIAKHAQREKKHPEPMP